MSTHTNHNKLNVAYFCTITCHQWQPLFEEAHTYDAVYSWFEHLLKDDCQILAYVIMPNHLHCLLYPTNKDKALSKLVGEGKRFMAYAIVNNLKKLANHKVLKQLRQSVQENEKVKGKKHQVFRLSFDGRECFDEKMLEQKLDYIHHNSVSGKWRLVEDFVQYKHSSAAYYELGIENKYITHYKELNDVLNT